MDNIEIKLLNVITYITVAIYCIGILYKIHNLKGKSHEGQKNPLKKRVSYQSRKERQMPKEQIKYRNNDNNQTFSASIDGKGRQIPYTSGPLVLAWTFLSNVADAPATKIVMQPTNGAIYNIHATKS